MKLISSLTVIACTLLSTPSIAVEHCPAVTNIKEVASGIFVSVGTDGKWIGLKNGFLPSITKVKSFGYGLAFEKSEGMNSLPHNREIKHCNYDTTAGKLDMKFETASGKPFSIETIGDEWREEEGQFGITYVVCENTAPENCKFSVFPDKYQREH